MITILSSYLRPYHVFIVQATYDLIVIIRRHIFVIHASEESNQGEERELCAISHQGMFYF